MSQMQDVKSNNLALSLSQGATGASSIAVRMPAAAIVLADLGKLIESGNVETVCAFIRSNAKDLQWVKQTPRHTLDSYLVVFAAKGDFGEIVLDMNKPSDKIVSTRLPTKIVPGVKRAVVRFERSRIASEATYSISLYDKDGNETAHANLPTNEVYAAVVQASFLQPKR